MKNNAMDSTNHFKLKEKLNKKTINNIRVTGQRILRNKTI